MQTLAGPSGKEFTDFDKIKFTIKTMTEYYCVATIGIAVETLRVAEYLTSILMDQLK